MYVRIHDSSKQWFVTIENQSLQKKADTKVSMIFKIGNKVKDSCYLFNDVSTIKNP